MSLNSVSSKSYHYDVATVFIFIFISRELIMFLEKKIFSAVF